METGALGRVLVDTSVWIEYFRKKEPSYSQVLSLMDEGRICCIGIIIGELLQGAKSEKELSVLRDFIHVFEFLPEDVRLWDKAGELSYRLRKAGKSAGLADCFIATTASINGAELLTIDRHFKVIREESGLKLYGLD